VFSDPFSVTYDGSAKSLPRTGTSSKQTTYRTADREFAVVITKNSPSLRNGSNLVGISLARYLPDPTPADVFNDYREIRNVFGLTYSFDPTRAETSVDVPRLRTALLALVDSTFQGRLISGEM
jgi:hypothetical protein